MARPQRNNVDYFPFICEDGNKMFYIEETYGNDGFATFVKLLRELAKTNYHYLDLSKPATAMFLSAKCKVSKNVLLQIITDLVELGKFDKQLWEENSIVWCQDFIDSIQDAYNKRNNKCITYDGLLHLLTSLGVLKHSKSSIKVPVNPHSKVKDSKVKDSNNNFDFKNELLNLVNDEDLVNDFLDVRKKKKAVNSKTAFNTLVNECQKHNYPLSEALKKCCQRNWAGFEYAWVEKDLPKKEEKSYMELKTEELERVKNGALNLILSEQQKNLS